MIGLLIAAQFATFAGKDPITLEPQALFAVNDGGNMLALYCRPGKNEIEARFVPSGYSGAVQYVPLWTPRADSRFGEQPLADKDSWSFGSTYLAYVSKSPLSAVKGTAEFIDELARNSEFNIRYEAAPDSVRTVTMHYELDRTELQQFIAMCNPRRVIERLHWMHSPAAP